jgi:beta-phosphoglucomutase
MIQAFLFDLDGVLTDTSEYHYRAWQRLAEELGISFTREDNEALRGVSRRESLNLLLKGRLVSEAEAEQMMNRKNSYYLELVRQMQPGDLLPGAANLLQELRAANLRSAIVSSSKNAPLVVERLGIGELVDWIVDGNAPARSKPAPDLFLLAAEKLHLSPAACIVVEDAAAGIEAAHAAGMRAIGLGPQERVGAADLVLPNLRNAHLKELLERLSG